MNAMQRARLAAAAAANAEDASVWRWFSAFLEERRIRWRYMFGRWVVHVDRTHVATEATFYDAIRAAKSEVELCGFGRADASPRARRLRSASSARQGQTERDIHPHGSH
jgi:hypothetical protein